MKVREADPRGMIAVKGDLSDETLRRAVCDVAGVGFPDICGAQLSGSQGLFWMAPDELLLLVERDAQRQAMERLLEMVEGRHVLVEDVSDMRAGFSLEGAEVRDTLARVTPADVSDASLRPGQVRRTRVGQVAAAIWLPEEGRAEVLCFRSVASYVLELLEHAAASEPLGLHHVAADG